MTFNKTSFREGNKAAVKSPKPVLRKFIQMIEVSKEDDDILCFGDACHAVGIRQTKADYWAETRPVLGNLKKEVQNTIIRRINKHGLKGDFSTGTAIWRMKQLGEVDSKEINNNINDQRENLRNIFDEVDEQIDDEEL